jgi:hypothetical protein
VYFFNKGRNMNQANLEQQEIEAPMGGVFTSNQQRRFIEYVASNPQSLTLSVNRATAIGNCSSIAGRVNKKLMPLGYVIACKQPSDSHPNRFGEPSNMFGWSLFTLPQTASNDDRYGFAVEVTK